MEINGILKEKYRKKNLPTDQPTDSHFQETIKRDSNYFCRQPKPNKDFINDYNAVGAKRIFLQLNCCKNLYHQSQRENIKITVNIKVIK